MHVAESAFRRRYGASPWHLLVLVLNLAVVGYVGLQMLDVPRAWEILLWFGAALVFQDFVLLPLLAIADRGVAKAVEAGPTPRVPWRNHVRVPLLLSGLLLLVFWPLVLSHAPEAYEDATGLRPDPYLGRWLALVGLMAGLSVLLYVVRVVRARRQAR